MGFGWLNRRNMRHSTVWLLLPIIHLLACRGLIVTFWSFMSVFVKLNRQNSRYAYRIRIGQECCQPERKPVGLPVGSYQLFCCTNALPAAFLWLSDRPLLRFFVQISHLVLSLPQEKTEGRTNQLLVVGHIRGPKTSLNSNPVYLSDLLYSASLLFWAADTLAWWFKVLYSVRCWFVTGLCLLYWVILWWQITHLVPLYATQWAPLVRWVVHDVTGSSVNHEALNFVYSMNTNQHSGNSILARMPFATLMKSRSSRIPKAHRYASL